MATTTLVVEEEEQEYDIESIVSCGVPREEAGLVSKMWKNIRGDVLAYTKRRSCSTSSLLCDPLMLLRFLRARDNDVDEAVRMYRDALLWRENRIPRVLQEVGSFSDDEEAWSWRPHRRPEDSGTIRGELALRHGHSRKLEIVADDEAPVLVWRLGKFDLSGTVREDVGDAMAMAQVAHLEDALQTCRNASIRLRRLVRARVIIDLVCLRIGAAVANFSVLKKMLGLAKTYFPEVTASVTLINAPFGFQTIWNLVSLILNDHMKAKVKICGTGNHSSVFRSHAHIKNVDELPMAIGGKASNATIAPCLSIPKGIGGNKLLTNEEPFVVVVEDES